MSPWERRPPLDDGAPLTNARIAAVLAEIADLLDIKGESSFKVGAYRRAADSVARSRGRCRGGLSSRRPSTLRGVGETISERIAELATSGRLAYHEALRAEVPPTLLELLAIPGVGPRTAGEVWRDLGIATLAELEAAARAGALRRIRGISARTEARIVEGIGELQRRPPRRMLMGEAQALAARMVALHRGAAGRHLRHRGGLGPALARDGRRPRRARRDRAPGAVIEALRPAPPSMRVEAGRPRRARPRHAAAARWSAARRHDHATRSGRAATSSTSPARPRTTWPCATVPASGAGRSPSAAWCRSKTRAAPITFANEAELYAFLGLAEIPPELREGRGEIEAAERDAATPGASRGPAR